MPLADDLKTISSDLDTLKTVVEGIVTGLDAPAVPSLADNVLAAVLPVLEAAGYTLPAPVETETPAEDAATGEEADATASPDAPTA
jgi:hypothetical protein